MSNALKSSLLTWGMNLSYDWLACGFTFFHKFKKWSCSQSDTNKINKWSNYQKQNLFCMQSSPSLVCELFSYPSVWLCGGLSWLHVFTDMTCLTKKDDRVQMWESWPVESRGCVRTEVPLMLQDTDGFGEPSASQTKTLCWPSSPRCLDSCWITGAPVTGCRISETPELEMLVVCWCRPSYYKVRPLELRPGQRIKKRRQQYPHPQMIYCHLLRGHNCIVCMIKRQPQ